MWIENRIFAEDMHYITSADFIQWERLNHKTIFITGATGLIGFYIVNALIYKNINENWNIKIYALARNISKAKELYREQLLEQNNNLYFINGEIENLSSVPISIDFIIHAAGPTESEFFAEKPVETILMSVCGTKNVLELAKTKQVQNMVFLSSMEAYGIPHDDFKIDEMQGFKLDTMKARNSYPESKRICEVLCSGYYSEFGVNVNCIRLTQTFGPGISEHDQRVFAQFIRAYINQEDILLLTEGKTKRSYLYLADAVTAVLTVLTHKASNELYNAANEGTYCSIREMAEMVASDIAHNRIRVIIDHTSNANCYLPELHMNLCTKKLQALNWKPKIGLKDMFLRTIQSSFFTKV